MKYKLSDVAIFISTKVNTKDTTLEKYISTENMLPDKGGITLSTSLPSTPKTNSFQAKDVLFSNIRTYFKKVWYATFNGAVSNDVLVIRSLDENILESRYLYYLLSDDKFIRHTVTTAKGTKMPRGDKSAIMNYKFKLPLLETQKRKAHILSTLDDKIELNRKMNQTLESMAQTLFKSWFVDFDPVKAKAKCTKDEELESAALVLGISKEVLKLFPSEFEESELGMIPKGWEVKSLDKIAHYQNGLALQKFRPKNENEYLPVVKISQLNKGYADGEEKADINIKPECIIDSGDVIFSWSGTLLVDIWCGGKGALNQHRFKVTSNNYSKWFYYYWTKQHLFNFQHIAASKAVTMGHIKRSQLEEALCVIPTKKIFDISEGIISPLLNKMIENRLENNNLQKTRDTLLSKLLSGELDVSDLDIESEG